MKLLKTNLSVRNIRNQTYSPVFKAISDNFNHIVCQQTRRQIWSPLDQHISTTRLITLQNNISRNIQS